MTILNVTEGKYLICHIVSLKVTNQYMEMFIKEKLGENLPKYKQCSFFYVNEIRARYGFLLLLILFVFIFISAVNVRCLCTKCAIKKGLLGGMLWSYGIQNFGRSHLLQSSTPSFLRPPDSLHLFFFFFASLSFSFV